MLSRIACKITLSPHSVKQICVVKQPVGDVKKQLGQDVASISKWYLEAYQRINDVIVKNQILVASFIGYLGDNISISEFVDSLPTIPRGCPLYMEGGVRFLSRQKDRIAVSLKSGAFWKFALETGQV